MNHSAALPMAPAANRIDRVRPDAPALAGPGKRPVGVCTRRFINPDQIDVLAATATATPRHDRALTTEIWYPAAPGTASGGRYDTWLRDGTTAITLHGRAARDATPDSSARYPLVVVSHGFPGNRMLMSHLCESLASRGYVVAAPDHTDSTYDRYTAPGAFASTLLNRPLDQRFVIEAITASDDPACAIADTAKSAIVGYSMGGYGALVFGGAGVTRTAVDHPRGASQGLLARHLAGTTSHRAMIDDRVKALVTIGPWGRELGFWDAAGLSAITKPLLIMAGSADTVSTYGATRQVFAETTGTTRHLLTFDNAGHSAAAPIPAPSESWTAPPGADFSPFWHYADPVWDSTAMNNIAQHFATAFLDMHLGNDTSRAAFLSPSATLWPGLSLETLPPERH